MACMDFNDIFMVVAGVGLTDGQDAEGLAIPGRRAVHDA